MVRMVYRVLSKCTYRQTTNNHNEYNTDNRNDKKRTP